MKQTLALAAAGADGEIATLVARVHSEVAAFKALRHSENPLHAEMVECETR